MTIAQANVTVNVIDLDKSVSFYESIGLSVTSDYEEAKSLSRQLSIETTEMVEPGGEYLIDQDPDGTALYISKLRGKA